MEEKGAINKILEKIEKEKKLETYLFYQEAPLRQILEVSDINKSKKQIEFKINGKIEAAINESKELYCKINNEILLLKPIIWNKEYLVTSFPSLAIEPKLKRAFPRVKCSLKNPIIFQEENSGIIVSLRDISEGGIGFKVTGNMDFKESNTYDIKLKIDNKEHSCKIKIVYKIKTNEHYKIGAKFVEPSLKLKDAIAKYVFERQMEIAKILSTFKD